jgi:hypothetical protein
MRTRTGAIFSLTALTTSLLLAPSAYAGHHRWDFSEIYSNGDGSVQYVELFSANDNEPNFNNITITSGANTFTFAGNLPSTATANTWALIATSGFAALPGAVAPDYVLPANFLSTSGGTLNYSAGQDVWIHGAVPTDGVNALQRDGSSATNSPTNFAGASGSVDLSAPVPTVGGWAVALLIGAILLASSGLLRRSAAPAR